MSMRKHNSNETIKLMSQHRILSGQLEDEEKLLDSLKSRVKEDVRQIRIVKESIRKLDAEIEAMDDLILELDEQGVDNQYIRKVDETGLI